MGGYTTRVGDGGCVVDPARGDAIWCAGGGGGSPAVPHVFFAPRRPKNGGVKWTSLLYVCMAPAPLSSIFLLSISSVMFVFSQPPNQRPPPPALIGMCPFAHALVVVCFVFVFLFSFGRAARVLLFSAPSTRERRLRLFGCSSLFFLDL